ncbi:hypothetical protein PAXRUDRAFT_15958 [Paxillus rubicundulus Ve08.2h10]|uniref:Uncharacterized protein n=1 Tax=Paxillus rubicundulus Ve08.2h10 TaxID=930991 RepID=A0A0D0D8N9_9AGAM|nr:hypothetical protein PAXRUDRAFT_15958 [Paxillus rubicundulus Ve08.2h10]
MLENSRHSSRAEMVLEGLPGDGPEGSDSQPEDSQQLEEESDDEIPVQAAQEVCVGSSKPEKQKQLVLQFSAAAVAVITTFFANDIDFEDPSQCVKFAKVMLKKSRFLFSQNRGMDNKVWSGLWRALFVLQTFAHHFNFIQGQVRVGNLDKEFKLAGPCMALALACTVVCRMLMLVSNKHITFKSSNSDNIWTTVIPKGNQYEFNETIWGTSTRRYLDPIKELTDENFTLVVEDTQKYVKKASLTVSSVGSGGEDSEYDDLFAFC